LLIHKHEHVKCLSQFFDVTVVNEDADYQQICEKFEPELVLVESGVPNPACRRLNITNIRACAQIPKLGFLHADAFCNARAGFLSDMDHWGIETFFAIATTAGEHTPAIAKNLFIWPNFIDPEIYRDYNQWKSIPVLFSGNRSVFYPWRQSIVRVVSKHYPSLLCPHPGYSSRKSTTQIMVGESYARMLNSSWFVPACGTIAKEVVRKHFEIPACNACLVAEKSPALEAAGFIDMANCVFADDNDVLDKLDYLFENRDALNEIINAGFRLVHSRHTIKNRDQIFQWFSLRKILAADQKIVQRNPFEPLTIVSKSGGVENRHIVSNGLHLELLRSGDKLFSEGKYESARKLYLKCASYISYMPEPKLRLAIFSLYRGNAREALSWILEPIQFTLAEYKASDPDPIEWAYFIIALICLGRIEEAVVRTSEFGWLRNPELDRVRWVVSILRNGGKVAPVGSYHEGVDRPSIHQLPRQSFDAWIEQLCIMLRACGQDDFVRTVKSRASDAALLLCEDECGAGVKKVLSNAEVNLDKILRRRWSFAEASVRADVFFKRRLLYCKAKLQFRRLVSDILHRLETRFRYFLPYRISESREDEFFRAIRKISEEGAIKAALVVGVAPGRGSIEAILAGVIKNRNNPLVFCINGSIGRLPRNRKRLHIDSSVKWYWVSGFVSGRRWEGFAKTIDRIKDDSRIEFFDLVLVNGSAVTQWLGAAAPLMREQLGARYVIFDGLDDVCNYKNHSALLRNPDYFLAAHNPGLRNGYSIFEKRLIFSEVESAVKAGHAGEEGID
jgi:tetratricopeptide (TPR) repeat protein